jgi:hypothetical protein
VKVVCCQQESYGDANKVLFSRRLKSGKVCVCGCVCVCGSRLKTAPASSCCKLV